MRWHRSAIAAAAISALVCTSPGPAAQENLERLLTSKLELLSALVNNSPNSIRIRESDDEAAKKRLSKAVAAYQEARLMLSERRFEAAERALDAGLVAASEASRRVSDRRRELQLQQRRYDDLSVRVRSYREAFERVAQEKSDGEVDTLLDRGRIDAALHQARALSDAGNYREANARLLHAAELLERALSEARHQETLLHALRFDTPMEEYEYELQRNQSYEMLLDLLLQEKGASVQGMVQKLTGDNDQLRRQSELLAAAGEAEEAIARLEEATGNLIRALQLGGLALP